MTLIESIINERLLKQKNYNLSRELINTSKIDFCSNDYLGFSDESIVRDNVIDRLQDFKNGSTGSRLLRGHNRLFEQTEEILANFCNTNTSLIFPSGYQANLALISSIAKISDVIFSDQLNHASIIDGISLSKANKVIFSHNDLKDLENKLKSYKKSDIKIIICESIYSMNGDFAKLEEFAKLAKKYSAMLIVDEAHATGIFNCGIIYNLKIDKSVILASIHTGGKALGVSGAWIACDKYLKDYLINFSRPFIYSTAPSPTMLLYLQESLNYFNKVGKDRAKHALGAADEFKRHFNIKADSLIIPIILNSTEKTLKIASTLQDRGFDIRAIRPPTVAENQSRLRITITYKNIKHLDKLRNALEEII